MGTPTVKIGLKDFARNYFSQASELLASKPEGMEMDDFYKEMACRLGIEERVLMELHHPFHWVMFCKYYGQSDSKKSRESHFEQVPDTNPQRSRLLVRMKDVSKRDGCGYLYDRLMREYGDILRAKFGVGANQLAS